MIDIIQIAGSLGVGAFLGLVIFFMYRQDRRGSEKRLSHLLEQDQESRKENTEVLTKLTTAIERINGRLK